MEDAILAYAPMETRSVWVADAAMHANLTRARVNGQPVVRTTNIRVAHPLNDGVFPNGAVDLIIVDVQTKEEIQTLLQLLAVTSALEKRGIILMNYKPQRRGLDNFHKTVDDALLHGWALGWVQLKPCVERWAAVYRRELPK